MLSKFRIDIVEIIVVSPNRLRTKRHGRSAYNIAKKSQKGLQKHTKHCA